MEQQLALGCNVAVELVVVRPYRLGTDALDGWDTHVALHNYLPNR